MSFAPVGSHEEASETLTRLETDARRWGSAQHYNGVWVEPDGDGYRYVRRVVSTGKAYTWTRDKALSYLMKRYSWMKHSTEVVPASTVEQALDPFAGMDGPYMR